MKRSNPIRRILMGIVVLSAWVTMRPAPARADLVNPVDAFQFRISEDLNVLRNPSDSLKERLAVAKRTAHELKVARNMPYIELKNTGDLGKIATMTLTIGDTNCNFDYASLIEASSGITFSVNTPDAVPNQSSGDVLQINFTGFDPGEYVRFRIDIDPDSAGAYALCDYRYSMFNLNGDGSTDGNAKISVLFSDPGGGTTTLGPSPLPNWAMEPLAGPLSQLALGCNCCGEPDRVTSFGFSLTSEPPLQEEVVPEPQSIVLLLIASVPVLGLLHRRARARSRA